MRETRRQLTEAETQLGDVERQLGMHRRRPRPGGDADEPQAKMPRLGAEELNSGNGKRHQMMTSYHAKRARKQ